MIHRRGLLLGLGSALAAPAIVHAGNLMPIKPLPFCVPDYTGLVMFGSEGPFCNVVTRFLVDGRIVEELEGKFLGTITKGKIK